MSNPKHPIITFRVNLTNNSAENVGPNTNPNNAAILHPDMHNSDADVGRAAIDARTNQKVTYIPGFLTGENVKKNHDDTFTVYGLKAKYIKDTYTVGTNPILSVVTETFESA